MSVGIEIPDTNLENAILLRAFALLLKITLVQKMFMFAKVELLRFLLIMFLEGGQSNDATLWQTLLTPSFAMKS